MTALAVDGLSISAGDRQIVVGLNFAIDHGEILAILGETGSGKSLIGSAVMGLLPTGLSMAGKITIDGRTIPLSDRRRLRALWADKLFLLPQEPLNALAPLLSARNQVSEQIRGAARGRRTDEALVRMQLMHDDYHKRPFELSGGMAQRLVAAIASVTPADILVADEPTKGLDDERRDILAGLFRTLRADGRAILLITHDVRLVRAVADRVVFLHDGRFVEFGATNGVLTSPSSPYARHYVASDPAQWPRREFIRSSTPKAMEAHHLRIGAGGRVLADDLSFHCHAGHIAALLGRSGVGKTTLGRTLLGIAKPLAGTVEMRSGEPSGHTIQKLHQDPTRVFAPWQTIGKSLNDLSRLRHGEHAAKILPRLLKRFGLRGDLLNRRPSQISGGEAQRLALARILALSPRFLIADEPTSRLDPPVQAEVLKLLRAEVDETGLSVLLITHDHELAFAIGDRQMELVGDMQHPAHLKDITDRSNSVIRIKQRAE